MPAGPRWLTWWKWGRSHKPKEKQEAEPGIQASLNHGTLSRGASLTKGGARASGTKWSRRSFKKRPITIQEVNEIECQFEQECVHQGATIGRNRTDPLEPVFSHHNKVNSCQSTVNCSPAQFQLSSTYRSFRDSDISILEEEPSISLATPTCKSLARRCQTLPLRPVSVSGRRNAAPGSPTPLTPLHAQHINEVGAQVLRCHNALGGKERGDAEEEAAAEREEETELQDSSSHSNSRPKQLALGAELVGVAVEEGTSVVLHSGPAGRPPKHNTTKVALRNTRSMANLSLQLTTSGPSTWLSVSKCVQSTVAKLSSLSQRASGGLGEERRHPGGGRTSLSVKKVAPPTVPDPPSISHRLSGSSFGSGGSTSTDSSVFTSASAGSGSGSGSIGYCSAEQQDNRSSLGLDEAYYPPHGFLDMNKSEGFSGRSLPSPSHVSRAPIFSYPGSQHQNKLKGQLSPPGMMEDQGIDMTQSPGRESPSGSTGSSSTGGKTGESCRVLPLPGCRNSTTSLDSGRASADHRHPSTSSTCTSASSGPSLLLGPGPTYRLSGQSYDSMRHSYHSSSSSLGSGRIEDVHRLNAVELLAQGVPEHEVLNAWLTDLGLEDYYDLFVRAGYDMHTIIRMTPEDLTAIGVKKPNHRKQLKSEIALLNIPDGLPEFIPDTLEEWLSLLGLAEYSPSFRRQGYRTVEDVAQLTWEDLEDFGILRLGHQKKITLAIKRVKDILSGKWVPPPPTNSIVQSQCYTQEVMITTHAPPSPSDIAPCPFPELSSFSRPSHYDVPRPLIHPSSTAPTRTLVRPLVSDPYSHYGHSRMLHPTHTYQPDVVAIQIHERPPQPTVFNTFTLRPRSYDDGDLVPKHTNPYPVQHTEQYHGGTLPRPKGTVKPRPVAKITAKTRLDNSSDPDHSDMGDCSTTHGEYEKQQLQQIPQQHYASFHAKLTMKPPPPPPPKRTQSIEDEAIKSNKVMDDPHPLPPPPDNLSVLSYSEDSEDFPPPPAPMSASELIQHGSSTTVAASVRERLDNILQRNGAQWPSKIYGSPAHFNPATHPNKNYPNWNSGQDNNCRERSPADSHDSEDNDNEFRQRRNGSDASFKSTSSTESESMPFANDNPGTIKQRINRPHPALSMVSCNSPLQSPALSRKTPGSGWRPLEKPAASASSTTDVLSDIDNMLAGLTDELDAMLEEEKSVAAAASTAKK